MSNYKRSISFFDANDSRYSVTCEIKDGKFSMTGEGNGSAGQCQDHIKPATDAQKNLLTLWSTYHLNDMHAGCEHQEALGWNADKNLSQPCPTCGYKYGTKWLKRDLPADIIDLVDACFDTIDAEQAQRVQSLDAVSFDSLPEKIQALAAHLEITAAEAQTDITDENDCRFSYGGTDYLVCDDSEADEKAKESIENYVEECVLHEIPKQYQSYFDTDSFVDDCITQDGRGHTLNSWDGDESKETINGTTYFIYRQ